MRRCFCLFLCAVPHKEISADAACGPRRESGHIRNYFRYFLLEVDQKQKNTVYNRLSNTESTI